MSKVSVIIPSRNELFLPQTVEDVITKARGEVQVIVVLEGYWPDPILPNYPNLVIINHGKARGLRGAVNSAARIASGEYLMKIDAHCMFEEGYDEVLKKDCDKDWVVVPRRYSLDAESWTRKDKQPVDYLYCDPPSEENNNEINVRVWNEKNRDPELKEKLIDDIFTFQGSCWFMHRNYFFELELMDDVNYGSFRKEPQEITFKCWLSGGRVVRNKKTWYAHLHKGKQYGRGYSTSRSDFKKGDVYLTNWLSDSAWDKQTIPFRWMIDKFQMPGWDNFDWSKWEREEKVIKPVKLYQHIPMAGVEPQNPAKNESKFWNEGKFENFIAPHLPDDCTDQTFVEMGCDAGLFLKLAEDKGFRNVVGIEKNHTPVEKGLQYRDQIGYNYKILKRQLGDQFVGKGTFDIDELPVADYTLMSTFHYYIDINSWVKYLDRLRTKTRYVIMVSRPRMKRLHWKAYCSLDALRGYFKDWNEIGVIDGIPTEGDPSPRNLFSVIFESPELERIPIGDIDLRSSGGDNSMYLAMRGFAEQIGAGDIDPFITDYYLRWAERKQGRWSTRTIRKFVKGKYDMMVSVRDNGLKDPIIIDQDNRLCDGGHRLAVLDALGYESVIVRRV